MFVKVGSVKVNAEMVTAVLPNEKGGGTIWLFDGRSVKYGKEQEAAVNAAFETEETVPRTGGPGSQTQQ